jgi:hypothetical protein
MNKHDYLGRPTFMQLSEVRRIDLSNLLGLLYSQLLQAFEQYLYALVVKAGDINGSDVLDASLQ